MMKSLCVFCGANKGNLPAFEIITVMLGEYLAAHQITLVFGAGKVGLMGVLADTVLKNGGEATGVIPTFLKDMEVCHTGLTKLIEVQTMHQRKQIMADISDAFLVLPGGFGTLDEMFEILTWKQLHLHQKPVGLLNFEGYYDHLVAHIDKMVVTGFLRMENRDLLIIGNSLTNLLENLQAYKPRKGTDKWLDKA